MFNKSCLHSLEQVFVFCSHNFARSVCFAILIFVSQSVSSFPVTLHKFCTCNHLQIPIITEFQDFIHQSECLGYLGNVIGQLDWLIFIIFLDCPIDFAFVISDAEERSKCSLITYNGRYYMTCKSDEVHS